MKRRTVLGGIGLGAVAGCLALASQYDRLRGADDDGPGPDGSGEHLPFDVWREIREALRTSPDHLPARAERLVAEGDPEAIFAFVRESVVTIPGLHDRVGDTLRDVRWGVRGTLRGGAGTPREKADLLVHLYRQAGFDAEVLAASLRYDAATVERIFYRPPDRRFDPAITGDQLDAWNARMGLTQQVEFDRIDDGGTESRALADAVATLVPPSDERLGSRPFDWRWRNVPVVRVVVDGEPQFANLFDPDLAFGEAGIDPARLRPAPAANPFEEVEVTLSTATAHRAADRADPERIDLVSGTWTVEELVGRQLLVSTLPGIDPFERPDVRFSDVRSFVPAIGVQDATMTQAEAEALSVVGDPVARNGARFVVEADGQVARDGRPLVPVGETSAEAERVTAVAVTADPSQFGDLQLEVTPTDANGDPVEGLGAWDFEVRDEGQSVGIDVQANRATPRVLILVDRSGSMPAAYRGEAMEALVDRLTDSIGGSYPGATVDLRTTDSDLWRELAQGAGTDANLLVYATDGHVNDRSTPEIEAALRAGPPAVMLHVHDDLEDETLVRMAELTGGTVAAASDHAAAEDVILDFLGELDDFAPYAVAYAAPVAPDTAGPGERRVTVRLPATGVEGSTTYQVPDRPQLPPHLCGLYVTVRLGRDEVTRTIAGFDPVRHDAVTPEMVRETTGALFGSTVLAVEGESPGHAVWFDDFLGAKSSVASLDLALIDGDRAAIDEAWAAGVRSIPPAVVNALAPLPDPVTAETLTFADGPRLVLYHERPVFGAPHLYERVDLLSLTRFATVASDPETAYLTTLEKTARLAVLERDAYDVSTASLLAGVELAEFDRHHADFDPDLRFRWRDFVRATTPDGRDYQFIPADGSVFTYWNVDYETGSLVGILHDGSGGGTTEQRIQDVLEEVDRIVEAMNRLIKVAKKSGGVNPIGAAALGVVAQYGQLLARMYGAATLALATMDASGLEESARQALADFACEVARKNFKGVLGLVVWPGVERLITTLGGDGMESCD